MSKSIDNWSKLNEIGLGSGMFPRFHDRIACKISNVNCLYRSAVNVAFAIIAPSGMSLSDDAQVVIRSIPVRGLTI